MPRIWRNGLSGQKGALLASLSKRKRQLNRQPHKLAANLLVERALASFPDYAKVPIGPVVLVVEVPDASFVQLVINDLIARAGVGDPPDGDRLHPSDADRTTGWPLVAFSRDGTSARAHNPQRGNEAVAIALSLGSSIIGVAPAPKRHLPAALLAAADHHLRIPWFDASIVTRVVAGVLRRAVRRNPLGDDLCRLLSLQDLCISIRPRSAASACFARLRRMATAKAARPADAPSLAELHGLGEARAWGEALACDIRAYRNGEVNWSAIDRGILLAGPPGTGKTIFPQALARSCETPLITGSLAMWQAAGALDDLLRAMRRSFDDARRAAPGILFIDELDSFGNRATFAHRYRDYSIQVVNGLLEELDGVGGREGVVVVGACNHPQLIDPAIIRSGRLDRVVELGLPSVADLAGILRFHLRGDLPDQDLTPAALAAHGHTGADVERWVRTARRAARQAQRPLTFRDVLAAICEEAARTSPAERRLAAYHEAGHALVAILFGDTITRVSIIARGTAGGSTSARAHWTHNLPTRSDLRKRLRVLLAGRAAEELVFGEPSIGAGGAPDSDLAIATGIVVALETSYGLARDAGLIWRGAPDIADVPLMLVRDPDLAKRVSNELTEAYAEAMALLNENRGVLERMAEVLIAAGHVESHEIEKLLRRDRLKPVAAASRRRVRTRGRD